MSGLQEGGVGKEPGKAPRRWLRWPVLRSVVLLCLLRLCAVVLMGCQPAQPTCTDERDCMGNQYCAEGVCRNTCETAVDCLGNEECNTQGKCVEKGTQRAVDAGETTALDAGGTPEQTGGTGQEAVGPDAPGPDVPQKPSCTGFPLRQNSRFDVDLKAIVLSGRVTVNGKTMPTLPFGRGKLVFRHHKGGTASSLSFGREGEARYQVKLFPGVYDISYQPDSTCSPKESTIPCLSYPLATGKQLMQSGSLSFDLPVVELSGRVTLSGKTMPSSVSSYRGGLSFQLVGGGSVGTGSFAKSGDIRFRVRLFAGTYGIRYVPSSSCDRERDPLPCQSLSVRSGLVIKQNSTYNVDLKAVAISGVLSRNGIKLTDVSRGAIIRFESLEEGTGGLSFLLASSGTLRYQGKIFAGTYKVMYKPPGACSENFAFPCMAHQLRSSVTLRQASQLDLDAKVTQIAGQVTVNKASPPAHIASRGALSFSSPWGTVLSKPFPASGPMQYQVKLFVARYTVSYKSGSRCQRDEGIPCQSLKVASDLSIVQASQKHFDLPVVTLASRVTLRGAALPASTRGRGTLQYLPIEGQPQGTTTSVSFGTSGDVVVKQRLFAGTYNIVYRPSSTCREPSPLPCQQMLYKRGLVVTQPSTFHVDLTSIQVAGSVTLAGKPIPTATGERGTLVFSRKDGGTVRTTSFPRAGTLRYQVQLFPGEYTIQYQHSSTCKKDDPLPCMSWLIKGCSEQ